jgi:GNAT superfamily N-acetyltransferase
MISIRKDDLLTLQRAKRCWTTPSAAALAQELATPARRTVAGRRPRFRCDRRQARRRHGQLWTSSCGTGQPALLLGRCAVASDCRNRGFGAALVRRALSVARRGHRACILVGDAPYYGRFGFSPRKLAALRMPGPFERQRLLGLELVPDALEGARGLLRAPARPLPSRNRRFRSLISRKILVDAGRAFARVLFRSRSAGYDQLPGDA